MQACSQVCEPDKETDSTAGHASLLFFKPHKGPQFLPCKITESSCSFCRRICFAFWVPVIISNIVPTPPSVLGGGAGVAVETQTDCRRRKVLLGHSNPLKGFDEMTSQGP